MFVINTSIQVNFIRAKSTNPPTISSIRVFGPKGTEIYLTGSVTANTNPTATTTGLFSFNFTPTVAGLFKIQLLKSNTPFLDVVYEMLVVVVPADLTYSTTISV